MLAHNRCCVHMNEWTSQGRGVQHLDGTDREAAAGPLTGFSHLNVATDHRGTLLTADSNSEGAWEPALPTSMEVMSVLLVYRPHWEPWPPRVGLSDFAEKSSKGLQEALRKEWWVLCWGWWDEPEGKPANSPSPPGILYLIFWAVPVSRGK